MSPRLPLSLASAAFVAFVPPAALAAPPPPPPPASAAPPPAAAADPAPPAAPAPDPAAAPTSAPPAPLAAPPPAPLGARPPWMQRPPPPGAYGPYPGWRLEEAPQPGEAGERQWYGWQSLIGIIPSHGMSLLALYDLDLLPLVAVGMIGHSLSSPIVHWVHGNVGRGFLSLGLNIGLPAVSYGIAAEFRSEEMLVGLGLLSIVGWPIIDTVVLSYEDAPKAKDKSARLIDSFMVVPMIDGQKKGLSLVGQF